MEIIFIVFWQIVITPFVIFMNIYNIVIYTAFFIVEGVIRLFGYDPESSKFIFTNTILASVLVFLITLVIYKIFVKFNHVKTFKFLFKMGYLSSAYFSGLMSLIYLFKPNMENDQKLNIVGLFASGLKLSMAMVFFIAVTNYNIFKSIILEGNKKP